MSLQPGIFENEEGERNLPFGDDQNTPFYATSKGDRSDGTEGGGSSKELTVEIDASTLSPQDFPNSHVLLTWEGTHTIAWQLDPLDAVVVNATWLGYKDDKGTVGPIMSAKDPWPSMPKSLMQPGMKRDASGLQFQQDKPTIVLSVNDTKVTEYFTRDMFLVLGWQKKVNDAIVGTGYTQSGLFTVYNGSASDSDEVYVQMRNRIMARVDQKGVDFTGQDINSTSSWFPPSSSVIPSTTSATSATTVKPSSTSVSGSENGNNKSGSDSGGGGGGGGLAPGAIAGIVIGAVFGVAIIAFLIWFLLRRRRRRADHAQNGGYGPGGPHEYLADKETHARVVESPHSPYSDDGQAQQHQSSQRHLNDIGQEPIAAAAIPASSANNSPIEHHHRPPFAPYNEQEHTSVASRSLDNVNSNLEGARSSTPNVNSNVSHLIEDGMTEDEIRRLEEEERALDAAIEQAGQGGQRR
ncbi:hypothetical protein CkaCkLH20_05862 [Colletotrichum karsti]|uniref:Mid2 domain-containing protein n=1 Tax=Colletotrichum karsti TaxID=1095194 RepID=A0A9P6I570_9PEZI|nr:uncharacterized protein CkaCkLH20_05862 [Colletotrichum karsti]KAF9876454.1 hypothetical protein CkaCkLH20_05862 [Colletotrichum karsti]